MGKFYIVLLVLIAVAICGCQDISSYLSRDFPEIDMKINNMNREMRLTIYRQNHKYKLGDVIFIELDNLSKYPITLTNDLEIRMYTWQDFEWISLENCMTYPVRTVLLLPKDQISIGWFNVIAYPCNFPDETRRNKIRVFVFGEQKDPDTSRSNKVGAYIDLWLSP